MKSQWPLKMAYDKTCLVVGRYLAFSQYIFCSTYSQFSHRFRGVTSIATPAISEKSELILPNGHISHPKQGRRTSVADGAASLHLTIAFDIACVCAGCLHMNRNREMRKSRASWGKTDNPQRKRGTQDRGGPRFLRWKRYSLHVITIQIRVGS